MPSSIRTKLTAAAAIAAAALGGSVVANAATSTTTSGTAAQQAAPAQRDPALGGHEANGKTEKLLTGDTAAKVEAAAKAKFPGATIERVENDVDTASAYEAHVRKADGSAVVVYVNSSFEVTGSEAMGHP